MLDKPYIGITDFMTNRQVKQMLEVQRRVRSPGWDRWLAVGIMTSWKVLHGEPTKWAAAWPKLEDIAGIFDIDPYAYNVLHYADYDGHPVFENMVAVRNLAGSLLEAIQLDMIWPDPVEVKEFRSHSPEIDVILQVNAVALAQVGDDPEALVERLVKYGNSVTAVLLDKSMGRGKGMDADVLLPFARAVNDFLPTIHLAAAGGLGPDTLHLADALLEEFPDISLDAQGRLRPSGNALDPIDWSMAEVYLIRAAERFDPR